MTLLFPIFVPICGQSPRIRVGVDRSPNAVFQNDLLLVTVIIPEDDIGCVDICNDDYPPTALRCESAGEPARDIARKRP
jgi:hypothetical protein